MGMTAKLLAVSTEITMIGILAEPGDLVRYVVILLALRLTLLKPHADNLHLQDW